MNHSIHQSESRFHVKLVNIQNIFSNLSRKIHCATYLDCRNISSCFHLICTVEAVKAEKGRYSSSESICEEPLWIWKLIVRAGVLRQTSLMSFHPLCFCEFPSFIQLTNNLQKSLGHTHFGWLLYYKNEYFLLLFFGCYSNDWLIILMTAISNNVLYSPGCEDPGWSSDLVMAAALT